MAYLDFNEWLEQNEYQEDDDETVCMALISELSRELKPRIVLENFPKNLIQAKFFVRNCKAPANVFALECPIDVCQERMQEYGESRPGYVQSSVLSQQIKEYFKEAKDLLPYLKAKTNYTAVSTDQSIEKTMAVVDAAVEPCVVHVRPGANSNDLKKEITEQLEQQKGFMNLDVNALIRDENERKTAIG